MELWCLCRECTFLPYASSLAGQNRHSSCDKIAHEKLLYPVRVKNDLLPLKQLRFSRRDPSFLYLGAALAYGTRQEQQKNQNTKAAPKAILVAPQKVVMPEPGNGGEESGTNTSRPNIVDFNTTTNIISCVEPHLVQPPSVRVDRFLTVRQGFVRQLQCPSQVKFDLTEQLFW